MPRGSKVTPYDDMGRTRAIAAAAVSSAMVLLVSKYVACGFLRWVELSVRLGGRSGHQDYDLGPEVLKE